MRQKKSPCQCGRLPFPHRPDRNCVDFADNEAEERWNRTATRAEYWADVERDERANDEQERSE